MCKQVIVAEVALQVAGFLFVFGKDFGHIEPQIVEMPAEGQEGLVLLNVVAVSAYHAARFGNDTEVVPRRPRSRNGCYLDGILPDGAGQFG